MHAEATTDRSPCRSSPFKPPFTRGARPHLRMMLSSAGRRVGLLRAFRSSANALGVDLEIFACDLQPEWSSACIESDFAVAVPAATSPDFVDVLLEYCSGNAISLLVPTIDTELVVLSRARDQFTAIGTTVAVSAPQVVEMARDKLACAEFLTVAGIMSPRTATPAQVLEDADAWTWPMIAKPRHGSSSRGVHMVNDPSSVARLADAEPYIVQEMLHGREFTVNLYFDEAGKLRSAVPHERLKVRGGEVEKGVTVRDTRLCKISRKLASALEQPLGAMCFQAIMDENGQSSVFEINARFGGGYPLAHRAGATFTRWMIEEQLALEQTANDDWRSAIVMLRYDDAVFV